MTRTHETLCHLTAFYIGVDLRWNKEEELCNTVQMIVIRLIRK
jgi:hypothetical protein